MSLRVHSAGTPAPAPAPVSTEEAPFGAATGGAAGPPPPSSGDDWSTRIAKLIPAEALGLYGSAVAMVTVPDSPTRQTALWIIVAICCLLTVVIRYRATLDPATGKPQWAAIGISLVSFLIWLVALGGQVAPALSPITLPDGLYFVGPLAALLWGTLVPYIYKGD